MSGSFRFDKLVAAVLSSMLYLHANSIDRSTSFDLATYSIPLQTTTSTLSKNDTECLANKVDLSNSISLKFAESLSIHIADENSLDSLELNPSPELLLTDARFKSMHLDKDAPSNAIKLHLLEDPKKPIETVFAHREKLLLSPVTSVAIQSLLQNVHELSHIKIAAKEDVLLQAQSETVESIEKVHLRLPYHPAQSSCDLVPANTVKSSSNDTSWTKKVSNKFLSACSVLFCTNLHANVSYELKLLDEPQEDISSKVQTIDLHALLQKNKSVIFYHPHRDDIKQDQQLLAKSDVKLSYFDVLKPQLIIKGNEQKGLLELVEPKHNRNKKSSEWAFETLSPIHEPMEVAIDSKMQLNSTTIISQLFQPQFEVQSKKERNITKRFDQLELDILQKDPFAKSFLGLTAFKMTNRNFQRISQSIEHLEKIPLDQQIYEKSIQAKALASPLGSKEGYGVDIELQFLENKNPSILQHTIVYILDGSKKTPKDHFEVYKSGIHRSLKSLPSGTKFNIIYVGKTIESLFESAQEITLDKQVIAKRFLGDIYSYQGKQRDLILKACLDSIPSYEEDRLTSIVVLADDITPRKRSVFLKSLENIAKIKHPQFAIHTASLQKMDRSSLKALSMMGGGLDVPFRSNFSFVRNFASTIRSIRYPIMHEVSITSLSDAVQILPTHAPTPPVYLHKPYKFTAIVQNLEPFEICLQSYKDGKILTARKIITPVLDESIRIKLKNEIEQRKVVDALEFYLKNSESTKVQEVQAYLEEMHF
jgi:hypothetical protein